MDPYLVFGFLAIAYLATAIGFAFLNDISQMIVQAPRDQYITVFHWRHALIFVSLAAFLVALAINYRTGVLGWKGMSLNLVIFILFFIGAFLLVSIMFPTLKSGANFVSVKEANQYIKDEDKMWVVDLNGDVRAFPHKAVAQPHIVEDIIGGQEVVMTFCDLSHLGIAYSPYINGEKVDLETFTQLQNNLIFYDRKTGEPIQQIRGETEHTKQQMKALPTQVMSYASFKAIYPEGLVLSNPPKGMRDRIVRWMLFTVDGLQHDRARPPVFPTINLDDPGLKRLPLKEMVWGVRIAGEQAAYTSDYFKQKNWIINTRLGGKDIVLVYYPEYQTVGGFDRDINGQVVTITDLNQIDIHGNTPYGKLNRIVVASEVFWMVWYTYYPGTGINT